MNTPLPYLRINCDRQDVPTHVVIESNACDVRPALRRTLARQPYESGTALWRRVEAQARALAAVHGLSWHTGLIVCYYGLPEGEPDDDAWNYRRALRWMCRAEFCPDVRLWAATKLGQLIGILPADNEPCGHPLR